MNTIAKKHMLVLGFTLAATTAAFAQAQTTDPKACSNAAQNAPTLSDKLSQTNGVICPPNNVDPNIKAPAPSTGKMPVIPPPGSPGGDPNVQPK